PALDELEQAVQVVAAVSGDRARELRVEAAGEKLVRAPRDDLVVVGGEAASGVCSRAHAPYVSLRIDFLPGARRKKSGCADTYLGRTAVHRSLRDARPRTTRRNTYGHRLDQSSASARARRRWLDRSARIAHRSGPLR